MIGRTIAGGITGLIAGGTVAAGLAMMAPVTAPGVGSGTGPAQSVEAPGSAEPAVPVSGDEPVLEPARPSVTPTPDVPGDADPVRVLPGQESGSGGPVVELETASVAAPESTPEAPGISTPSTSASLPRVSEPVLPSPLSSGPAIPEGEADVTVSTSAIPPKVTDPVVVADVVPAEAPVADATPPNGGDAEVVPAEGPAPQEMAPVILPKPGVTAPSTAELLPNSPASPVAEPSPIEEGSLPAVAAPRIITGSERVGESDLPAAEEIQVNRPGADTTEPAAAEEVVEAPMSADSALHAFAAPVPDLTGEPMMSIVLMYDEVSNLHPSLVSGLPLPVTLAMSATVENAPVLLQRFRDANIEVLAIADLPQGATPEDMEVALEGTFATLPETIGLLDAGAVGLGSDRAAIASAVKRLSESGRGLLTLSSGLNMAEREALRQGVPAAVVYRDLDGQGQAIRTIRRFLDQATFRARQQGNVVLLARLKTNTLSALDEWGRQEETRGVQIVPLSVLLHAQDAQ